MPKVTMYHNPRCSTCRKTLDLIRKHDIEPEIIEYLKTPPSREQLRTLLKLLNAHPRDIMRSKETAYSEHKLDNQSLTTDELIDAMITYPQLIQRPIIIKGDKAIIGRPPENVLKIIE